MICKAIEETSELFSNEASLDHIIEEEGYIFNAERYIYFGSLPYIK